MPAPTPVKNIVIGSSHGGNARSWLGVVRSNTSSPSNIDDDNSDSTDNVKTQTGSFDLCSPCGSAPAYSAPFLKTKQCRYWALGQCRYSDEECNFYHGHLFESESSNYGTYPRERIQCRFWDRNCMHGEKCHYYHGTIQNLIKLTETEISSDATYFSVRMDCSVYGEQLPASYSRVDIIKLASQFGELVMYINHIGVYEEKVIVFPSKRADGKKAFTVSFTCYLASLKFIDYITENKINGYKICARTNGVYALTSDVFEEYGSPYYLPSTSDPSSSFQKHVDADGFNVAGRNGKAKMVPKESDVVDAPVDTSVADDSVNASDASTPVNDSVASIKVPETLCIEDSKTTQVVDPSSAPPLPKFKKAAWADCDDKSQNSALHASSSAPAAAVDHPLVKSPNTVIVSDDHMATMQKEKDAQTTFGDIVKKNILSIVEDNALMNQTFVPLSSTTTTTSTVTTTASTPQTLTFTVTIILKPDL